MHKRYENKKIDKPFLSIITVVFNAKDTIENTIKSVAHQNYRNFEYIIVDGESTDGTLSIIDKYQDSIDCIISEPDSGIYDAMNKGVSLSKGDVIYFLGADDVIADNNSILDMMNYYKTQKIDMLYGNVTFMSKSGDYNKIGGIFNYKDIKAGRRPPHQAIFMDRRSIINFSLFNLNYRIASDFDLICKFYIQKKGIGYLDRDVAVYGIDGVSSRQKRENYRESSLIVKFYFGYLRYYIFIIKKKIRLILNI